jgi:NAD(P)-dependent dehydrogenase (short-subunit alcohol dehydrogenase family)
MIITGAASGMGRATAARLVSEGAAVFGVDRSGDGLAQTSAISGADADHFIGHVADVSEEPSVIAAVEAAVDRLGGVDVLVNVAGIQRTTPLATITPADMLELFSVNTLGTLLFCREVAPHLPDKTGVIVNIASTSASKGYPYMSAYAASKGAVLALSQTLAAELAPRGIRVVTVSPGTVQTPLAAGVQFPPDADRRYFARVLPLLDVAQPEDIAGAIAFAASTDGKYWTGSELRIDGGAHI